MSTRLKSLKFGPDVYTLPYPTEKTENMVLKVGIASNGALYAERDPDKQDRLIAGQNISIEDGVISATGGGAEEEVVVFDDNATFDQINAAYEAGKKCVFNGTVSYGSGLSAMSATVTIPLTSVMNNMMAKIATFSGTAKLSGMGGQAYAYIEVSRNAASTGFTRNVQPFQYKLTAGANVSITGNTISAASGTVIPYVEGEESDDYSEVFKSWVESGKHIVVKMEGPDFTAYYTPILYANDNMYFVCDADSAVLSHAGVSVPRYIYVDDSGIFAQV